MDDPEISILMPARDAWPWLQEAVGDLLRQEGVRLEVVAVDDGSRDRTGTWLARTARRDPRLRVLQSGGAGPAAALNLALRHARSPLIGQMEADDRCSPARFRQLRDALRAQPRWDGVVSRADLLGPWTARMRRYVEWQNGLLEPDEMARQRFVEIPALHQTGLYRREVLETLEGYRDDPRWPLDIDFWMRLYERSYCVAKLPVVLYWWRQHERQSTRTSPRHRTSSLRSCKAHFFGRGPGRGKAIQLLSVGRTLAGWSCDLLDAGVARVEALEWRPGRAVPPRDGELRLFAFGSAAVRRRIRGEVPGFDPARDWFVA